MLGANEIAARDLGISQRDAVALQRVASAELGFLQVPEPGSLALFIAAFGLLSFVRRHSPGRVDG